MKILFDIKSVDYKKFMAGEHTKAFSPSRQLTPSKYGEPFLRIEVDADEVFVRPAKIETIDKIHYSENWFMVHLPKNN